MFRGRHRHNAWQKGQPGCCPAPGGIMTRFQNFQSALMIATSLVATVGACGTSSNKAASVDGGTADGASSSEGPCDTYFDAQLAYSSRCTERYDPARAADLRQRFDTQCAASLNSPSETGFANYL